MKLLVLHSVRSFDFFFSKLSGKVVGGGGGDDNGNRFTTYFPCSLVGDDEYRRLAKCRTSSYFTPFGNTFVIYHFLFVAHDRIQS